MIQLTLRPATPDDLPFRVALHNRLHPDEPTTLADVQRQNANRRADLVLRRYVAEVGGQAVGLGVYTQQEWMFHPQKFAVNVQVKPEWQGQGIGKHIWERLEEELRSLSAIKLFSSVREDASRSLRFLIERGFVEEQRERESALNLADANLSGLDSALARAKAGGYQLLTFAEYAAPDKERQLYTFDESASQDEPHPPDEVFTFPSFERYWTPIHANPNLDFSLWFVAVREGEIVGLSQLNPVSAQPDTLMTGFTATARAHRRQGLALALKLLALSEAKRRGYLHVKTGNDATNAPMIAINDVVGFVPQPAQLWMAWKAEAQS
ncbi:GNAT family N-acetyltransferase [Deinococcus psychrotolerans]|uniref:GNAT family N-acetyltransferase n=1 Tax=Deinococcus psychrotolerans TaxID=2489213 RepID=A0A3G8YCW1_9DEIO|nr:GNAT family N-acetyltransferase [Deinococcus psychrotolerans]AZI43239.1 GNAT family N-acetyltransferase [Deinococcus psychrotolerans]